MKKISEKKAQETKARLSLSGNESGGVRAGMSEYARVCLAIDTVTGFTSLWNPNMN